MTISTLGDLRLNLQMSEITGKTGQSLRLTAVAEQISPQIDRGCDPGLNKPKKTV